MCLGVATWIIGVGFVIGNDAKREIIKQKDREIYELNRSLNASRDLRSDLEEQVFILKQVIKEVKKIKECGLQEEKQPCIQF